MATKHASSWSSTQRTDSSITVTDQFCGAGGSSIGATEAGLRVRLALNHDKQAVETHNTNFPLVDHDCVDISATDPRRYYATDVLITSPECTTHSPAGGGANRPAPQRDMFVAVDDDPSAARSRATAYDVLRFAEVFKYRYIIVENVVQFTGWTMFPVWLQGLERLGYRHKVVSLNSMHAHPTPQSRDRVYVVCWRKGERAPDLDIRPPAWCVKCARIVDARQVWKAPAQRRGVLIGKYGQQYEYACGECMSIVTPFYCAAYNAIDWTIPGTRIGDRVANGQRELKATTLARIAYGMRKYGQPVQVMTSNTGGGRAHEMRGRVRGVLDEPSLTQTGSNHYGVSTPAELRARPVSDAGATQTCRQEHGIAVPWLITRRGTSDYHLQRSVRDLRQPLETQATNDVHGVASTSPWMVTLRGTERTHIERAKLPSDALDTVAASGNHFGLADMPGGFLTTAGSRDTAPRALDEASPAQTGSERLALVTLGPALLMTQRDSKGGYVMRRLIDALAVQASGQQTSIITPRPFLSPFYTTHNASSVDEPAPTQTVRERCALIEPSSIKVDDCYFRMMEPDEIGVAMAFPREYIVLGSKRVRVKQYGNAVTPPSMRLLLDRVIEAMDPTYVRRPAWLVNA